MDGSAGRAEAAIRWIERLGIAPPAGIIDVAEIDGPVIEVT